jgi:hypothetical protein
MKLLIFLLLLLYFFFAFSKDFRSFFAFFSLDNNTVFLNFVIMKQPFNFLFSLEFQFLVAMNQIH